MSKQYCNLCGEEAAEINDEGVCPYCQSLIDEDELDALQEQVREKVKHLSPEKRAELLELMFPSVSNVEPEEKEGE